MLTAIHKFYSLDQWAKAINSSQIDLEHCAVTFGVEEAENAEEFFDYLVANSIKIENKDIDVLIFGRNKPETQEYLDLLDQNNIKYLSVDPYMELSNTIEKLAKLISKSKIVINLTKTLNGKKFFREK